MSVELQASPATRRSPRSLRPANRDLDGLTLDRIDRALDRGDLETVRSLLGFSAPVWRVLLAQL